jgi:hypothetical protein
LAAEGHLLNEHLNAQNTNKQIPQNYGTKEEKAATREKQGGRYKI